MSSRRQIMANRANAQKSTGPRTAVGKARSAGNARRHGLTAPPEAAAVRRWFRIILDDPEAIPSPLEQDPRRRAARDLAEAEAQLELTRLAEEQNLRDCNWSMPCKAEIETLRSRLVEANLAGRDEEAEFLEHTLQQACLWRVTPEERKRRTLARYRASAETRRRKALRRWINKIAKRTQSGI